ncbi:MAG: SH3 domain-containing C40 family peptidase [Lachnospiraceae bacterium]|nr:SH3 domain-containing C40 family peptidase [Lachnospiraceae bacterium]
MNHCGVKLAAGALAAVITFSGLNIDVMAANRVSSVLPTGGVNLSLVKDTPLESIQTASVGTGSKIETGVSVADIQAVMDAAASGRQDSEEELFKNLVIAQVNDYVNIRSMPSEEGEIVGKLYDDSVGTFISEENGWYQITSGTVTGYVKAEYCVTGEAAVELARQVGTRLATVTTTTLYVRKEPTTDSSIIAMVPEGEDYLVLEETDGWIKITSEEGDGFVSKDYVDIRTEFVEAESKAEEEARLAKEAEERRKAREAARASQSTQQTATTQTTVTDYAVGEGSELGVAVAEYALQFVGNPYKWGGTSLTDGADCSGFVLSVYANFGVSLPHSSKADRSQGSAVDGLENAQPGDLICYSGHVALYIGNGQIVHAANSKKGIIVSNADYKKILAIRRIF